jgi:hypothetical protein
LDTDNLAAGYRGLPAVSQIEALWRLGHELTIVAREEYGGAQLGGRHPKRLCRLNEVQHRIYSQVLALLNTGQSRCPDEALTAAILNHDDPYLRRQVAAFARCIP